MITITELKHEWMNKLMNIRDGINRINDQVDKLKHE